MENITDQYRHLLPEALYLGLGEIADHRDIDLLSDSERDEYGSLTNEGRRREFIAARAVLKKLARSDTAGKPDLEVRKDSYGKPYGIRGNDRYYVSLAHCGDRILCGYSAVHPVGVDIEPSDRKVAGGLRQRICHRAEREALAGEPVLRIWTMKEALVKLEGRGLRTNLNDITLAPHTDSRFRGRIGKDKSAIICSFQHGGYWIAAAYFGVES